MKRTKDNWTPYPFGEDGYLVTTKDEPIWNRPFRVVGIQMVGIDNQPMGAYLMELNTKKKWSIRRRIKTRDIQRSKQHTSVAEEKRRDLKQIRKGFPRTREREITTQRC